MARAQFIAETKPKPHRQRFVHLKLTEGEADLILAMCAAVGGSRKLSPRKYADRIRDSLSRTMNLHYADTDAASLMHGHISFDNYDRCHCPQGEEAPNAVPVRCTANGDDILREWEESILASSRPSWLRRLLGARSSA